MKTSLSFCLIFGFLILLLPNSAWSYPEFIGIGYSSCLTCHYNGQGNGAINDYGRALFSTEIAARTFTSNNEEKLSASSGFLGSYELPWWLRPGIKARHLQMTRNPGGTSQTDTGILMQAELNLALLFNQDQDFIIVGSYGYQPQVPNSTTKRPSEISREHYIRWHAAEPFWVYLGFLDKVYGIRLVDHTAFNRTNLGLGQNDQSHGIVLHYIQPTWEVTINPFFGNKYESNQDNQQRGVSGLVEFETGKDVRLGFSVLTSSNKTDQTTKAGFQTRAGIGYGASFLLDMGYFQTKAQNGATAPREGYYFVNEISQRLSRGYHLFFMGQAYKSNMIATQNDQFKAGAGLLMFPFPRFELRAEAQNSRAISPTDVSPESWLTMIQAHISL